MLDRTDRIEHRSYIEKSSETDEFKYKCEFLVGKFAPTDFKIKLKGGILQIEAIHETQLNPHKYALENFYYDNDETYLNESGSYLRKETDRFVRELRVPHFVDLDSLTCYLETYEDFQNVLVVEGHVDKRSDFDRTFIAADVNNNTKISTSNIHDDDESSSSPIMNSSHQFSSLNRSGKNDLNIEHNRNVYQLPQQQCSNKFNANSNQYVDSEDRVTSDTFLKYRFDLSDFDAKDIQITIRERSVLNVSAVRTVIDRASGKPVSEHFNHDIQLPDHVEIQNIKNCFDENDGILRIEIPLQTDSRINSPRTQSKNVANTSQSNNSDSNSSRSRESSVKSPRGGRKPHQTQHKDDDKYLELVFDLYDFKFDRVEIKESIDKRALNTTLSTAPLPKNKILVVRAFKADDYVYRPYLRKYVLPEWVNAEKMFVKQDRQIVDGELKNVLIVQIAIRD